MHSPTKFKENIYPNLDSDFDSDNWSYAGSRRKSRSPKVPREKKEQRNAGQPVAIRNVGNSCYLSSLLQSYYMLPSFYRLVLILPDHSRVVRRLQRCFAWMTGSANRYIDPTDLFRELCLTDTLLFDQQDITEFNLKLIEHLERLGTGACLVADAQSVFYPLFYGTEIKFIHCRGEAVKPIESVVGHFMLNVMDKHELYSACDKTFYCEVSGYKSAAGEEVTAYCHTFFKSLPKILLVQLNRVAFDRTDVSSFKVNTAFEFPKQFYVDRYLLANKQRTDEVRKREEQLQARIDELNKRIETEAPLDALRMVKDLIKDGYDLKNDEGAACTVAFLKAVLKRARKRAGTLAKEVAELERQKSELFEQDEFRQCPYLLHSILVHEGTATSGHYFCYVFDRPHNKWWCCNDTRVTEVEETEVFQSSFGHEGSSSAYCLVYCEPSILEEEEEEKQGTMLRTYSIGFDDSLYGQWVPEDLNHEVSRENTQMRKELEQEERRDLHTYISTIFRTRKAEVVRWASSPSVLYGNVCVYLHKFKPAAWDTHLLDLILREVADSSLDSLASSDMQLFAMLQKLPDRYCPSFKSELKPHLARFEAVRKMSFLLCYSFDSSDSLQTLLRKLVGSATLVQDNRVLGEFEVELFIQVAILSLLKQIACQTSELNPELLSILELIYSVLTCLNELVEDISAALFRMHKLVLSAAKQACNHQENSDRLARLQELVESDGCLVFEDDLGSQDLLERVDSVNWHQWVEIEDYRYEVAALRESKQLFKQSNASAVRMHKTLLNRRDVSEHLLAEYLFKDP